MDERADGGTLPLAPLDHLVVAVPDLEEGVRALEDLTGVRATPGGRHPAWGTHNALVRLGPPDACTYLELIAPDPSQPAPGRPRPFGLDHLWMAPAPAGEPDLELVHWAVRVLDIARRVDHSRSLGYDPGDACPMERARPDGTILRWTLTLAPHERTMGGVIPFLIDWGDTPHPAATLSEGLTLASFAAEASDRRTARIILDALGVDLDLQEGPRQGLRAMLEGPGGKLSLA